MEHAAEALREIQQREKENQEAYNPLQTFSAVLDFLPFIGNAKAGQEASTGVDLITGQELDEWDRGIAAASIFLGGIGKVGGRTLKNIVKGSDNFAGATRISNRVEYGDHYTRVDTTCVRLRFCFFRYCQFSLSFDLRSNSTILLF
ncbi:pre-toxin TG domain-containing protein [Halalkalibacterium halodurans]|uniref:BH3991 protein n=1 Tax=Halalkalibacterium halodurans (strain ATCC BAA-125 / DSM 18197 / FERM 7344 / JCM 9153 / C-125) TaxID=272558 RepID=Q9K5U7_HALH5|nr:pre-toxin TG domain-containing protein [Halalkalibacterium halodurans]MED3648488.1 pre-toxin TG domain-containing protein [Halalkalibacterium halodurans]BAB07710.1 BH3991 [Halalkalibacterium halodurans C-125]